MRHFANIVVKEEFRRDERMRIALIAAHCNLTFAAQDALRHSDPIFARDLANNARELVAVFGRNLLRAKGL